MILGITATREGLTPHQKAVIAGMIRHPATTEVHHGGCVGGDAFAHAQALLIGKRVVVHPADATVPEHLRAKLARGPVELVTWLPPKPPLVRNRDIVDAVDVLAAGPKSTSELHGRGGGGTWAAVRYARATDTEVRVVWP